MAKPLCFVHLIRGPRLEHSHLLKLDSDRGGESLSGTSHLNVRRYVRMQSVNQPHNRRRDIDLRVTVQWPTVPRWSLPTEGCTPVLLAMASPQLVVPSGGDKQAQTAIALAYVHRFSTSDPAPPGGCWWGFRVGTSEDVLSASQMTLPVPPLPTASEATVEGLDQATRIEIRRNDEGWWSTSVIRLRPRPDDVESQVLFTELLGRFQNPRTPLGFVFFRVPAVLPVLLAARPRSSTTNFKTKTQPRN